MEVEANSSADVRFAAHSCHFSPVGYWPGADLCMCPDQVFFRRQRDELPAAQIVVWLT